MADPISICEETFQTKHALEKRVQEILYGYRTREFLCGESLSFILELLLRHPRYEQKRGSGIAGIRIDPHMGKRCFTIVRTDGSETDFSYLKCVSYPSPRTEFMKACRFAVLPDILEFRSKFFSGNPPFLCAVSGVQIYPETAHVAHVFPDTFCRLAERWASEKGFDMETTSLSGYEDGSIDKRFTDPSLTASFRSFHQVHAVLRMVDRTANMRMGSTGVKS